MLNLLSNFLIKAYRKRSQRLAKQSELQAKAGKAMMDKAVSLRKQAGDTAGESFVAGVTADRLEYLLKPKDLEIKSSGKL
ncbi:hypothetical protein [Providencia phage PSTCR2]|uniref:Uncharacterized protein n=1 Tax=Providencia phage PSTCR2 TaxID=2783544 RepID=A0A873WN12_9CAUD|nr:hypothetical protein [Providencia phage PSTCR2]